MAGLDPAIHVVGHVRRLGRPDHVDTRIKSGHDDYFAWNPSP
jgi:hypothetical protein